MKADRLGIGIIGCGSIAQNQHLPAYARLADKVKMVAVADVNEQTARQAAEKFQVPHVFNDYHQLLALEEIDAVSICTPNYLHMEPAVAALRAGKHVLCEKPLARNAQEARAMVQAARQAGKILQVALQWRFTGLGQFLFRYIQQEGQLGNLYYARAHALRRRGIPGWGVFIDKEKQGGGPLIDIGVHILDLTLWLMGYPKPVSAFGATYAKFGHRSDVVGLMGQWDVQKFSVEDFAVGLIRFENGATVVLESSFCANIGSDEFNTLLLGDRGGVYADPLNNPPVRIYTEENRTLFDVIPAHLPTVNAYHAEVEAFVEAIRKQQPSPVPGEHGFVLNAILDAIYRSSETGHEVAVEIE